MGSRLAIHSTRARLSVKAAVRSENSAAIGGFGSDPGASSTQPALSIASTAAAGASSGSETKLSRLPRHQTWSGCAGRLLYHLDLTRHRLSRGGQYCPGDAELFSQPSASRLVIAECRGHRSDHQISQRLLSEPFDRQGSSDGASRASFRRSATRASDADLQCSDQPGVLEPEGLGPGHPRCSRPQSDHRCGFGAPQHRYEAAATAEYDDRAIRCDFLARFAAGRRSPASAGDLVFEQLQRDYAEYDLQLGSVSGM